jgi:hypothetical protein
MIKIGLQGSYISFTFNKNKNFFKYGISKDVEEELAAYL